MIALPCRFRAWLNRIRQFFHYVLNDAFIKPLTHITNVLPSPLVARYLPDITDDSQTSRDRRKFSS